MTNRSIKKDYPKRSPMNSKEVQFYFPCPFCQAIPFTGMALISKKKKLQITDLCMPDAEIRIAIS